MKYAFNQPQATRAYPGNIRASRMQTWMRLGVDESDLYEPPHHVRVAPIAEGAPEDGVGVGDPVLRLVDARVSVRKTFKCQAGQEVVLLRGIQETASFRYIDDLKMSQK